MGSLSGGGLGPEDLSARNPELILARISAYGQTGPKSAQPGFGAIEFEANVVNDAPDLVTICDDHDLSGLVRGPLGTGLLGGGHPAGSQITDVDDFRFRSPDWLNYFDNGRPVDRYVRTASARRTNRAFNASWVRCPGRPVAAPHARRSSSSRA